MPIKPVRSRIGRVFALAVVSMLASACVTASPIRRLHRGMNYADVAAVMGPQTDSFAHADGHVSRLWALTTRNGPPTVYSILFDPAGRLVDIAGPAGPKLTRSPAT